MSRHCPCDCHSGVLVLVDGRVPCCPCPGAGFGPAPLNPPLRIVYDPELFPESVPVPPRPHWQLDALLAMTMIKPDLTRIDISCWGGGRS